MSGTQEVGEIFGAGSGPAHAMLRSPTVLIAAIGLWGMNVYLFRAFGIDYVKVLKQDLLKLETANNNSMNNNSQHGGGGGTGANNSTTTTTGKQQQHRGGGSRTNALIIGAPMSRGGGIIHIARKDSSEYVDCENSFAASDTNSKSGINNNNLSMDIGEDDEFDIMESSNLLQQQVDDTTFANDSKITSSRLIGLSLTLLVVLHTTYTISISWLKTGPITAILAFYGAVTTAILLPFPSTRWLRVSAVLVFQRAYELVNPRCYYCCTLDTLTNVASTATAGATTSTTAAIINDENANGTQTSSNNKIPRPIPFIDVFFADAMCSLSKVFFDWGMLIHMAAYYPRPVSSSAWNILIPSAAAAVPYVIRARQCLVMWSVASSKNDPGRYQHLWNALKYCTSIFPLCLSAYQKTAPKERAPDFEIYLIILLFVNAAYALWWDVVMDWGMMKNVDPTIAATALCKPATNVSINGTSGNYSSVPTREHVMEHRSPLGRSLSGPLLVSPISCWHRVLRNRLRFGVAMSLAILATDVILRFSWVLRFYHGLFPSGDSFVLCTQFLEVFRRALWNLLRVEWENLKQSGQHLQPPTIPILKPPSSIQLTGIVSLGDEEKTSFLTSRTNKDRQWQQ